MPLKTQTGAPKEFLVCCMCSTRSAESLPQKPPSSIIDSHGPFGIVRGNASSCPFSAIGGLLGDGVQRPQSNALWASFDDTEGRWGSRERHIEGGYRLGETF